MDPDPSSIALGLSFGVVAALVLLLSVSAFLTAAEAAFYKLQASLKREHRQALTNTRPWLNHLKDPRALFSAIAVGKTVVSLAFSALFFAALLPCASHRDGVSTAFCLAGAVLLLLLLLVVELLPRRFIQHKPQWWFSYALWPFNAVQYVFRPIALPLAMLAGALLRLGGKKELEHRRSLSEEDLRVVVAKGERSGVLEGEQGRLINRVLTLGDTRVADVMKDRSQMFVLPANISFVELLAATKEHQYSRVPIYEDSRDNIVGILYVKDLLPFVLSPPKQFHVKSIVRPPCFVPLSKKANVLFLEFKQQKNHLALVVDEYAHITGLVTLEDLLEELFGEIKDEYDGDEASDYLPLPDGQAEITATLPIDRFCEIFGLRSEELPSEDIKTASGLVLSLMQRIPNVGEVTTISGLSIAVRAKSGNRLTRLIITPQSTKPNGTTQAAKREHDGDADNSNEEKPGYDA